MIITSVLFCWQGGQAAAGGCWQGRGRRDGSGGEKFSFFPLLLLFLLCPIWRGGSGGEKLSTSSIHLTRAYRSMPLLIWLEHTDQVRRSRLDKLLDQAQKAGCDVALAKMVLATRLVNGHLDLIDLNRGSLCGHRLITITWYFCSGRWGLSWRWPHFKWPPEINWSTDGHSVQIKCKQQNVLLNETNLEIYPYSKYKQYFIKIKNFCRGKTISCRKDWWVGNKRQLNIAVSGKPNFGPS